MISATQKSLDYYTAQFTPYQHKQVRILEFPNYASFAQSFANTIPFSESIGFIADLRDKEDIDYVFYVTAHEMAHQWWGHQVTAANVQGSSMLIESLSQYSALMVMEKEYGRGKMRRFLRYELDRYLSSRGGEKIEELPLMRVENQQYIHYRKGSLVFYRLRDEIGDRDDVARGLRHLLRREPKMAAVRPDRHDAVADGGQVRRVEHRPVLGELVEDDLHPDLVVGHGQLDAVLAVRPLVRHPAVTRTDPLDDPAGRAG